MQEKGWLIKSPAEEKRTKGMVKWRESGEEPV